MTRCRYLFETPRRALSLVASAIAAATRFSCCLFVRVNSGAGMHSRHAVDVNADLGESFGSYTLGNDREVLGLITSANVACGMHAGDPRVMDATVRASRDMGVSVGAHPGFPDRVGFGRRTLDATPTEIETDVLYQIGALSAFVVANGVEMQHVKAHGALYNLAVAKPEAAAAIARAVARYNRHLIFVAPVGSALERAGMEAGLSVAREAFADRSYNADATLVSRQVPGAVISDPRLAADRALRMVRERRVSTVDGDSISIEVDTLCVHGDNPRAAEILHEIRSRFRDNGITVINMRDVLGAS